MAYALGSFGPAARDAIEPLAVAAVGKDAGLHGPALMALGGVGESAVPTLVRLLRENALDVRRIAPLALALIGRGAEGGGRAAHRSDENDDVESVSGPFPHSGINRLRPEGIGTRLDRRSQ